MGYILFVSVPGLVRRYRHIFIYKVSYCVSVQYFARVPITLEGEGGRSLGAAASLELSPAWLLPSPPLGGAETPAEGGTVEPPLCAGDTTSSLSGVATPAVRAEVRSMSRQRPPRPVSRLLPLLHCGGRSPSGSCGPDSHGWSLGRRRRGRRRCAAEGSITIK